MKKIAITQRLDENLNYPETRMNLDLRWSKLFKSCDFVPIILPYDYDFRKIYTQIGFDGVILSGGNDLFKLSNNRLDKLRDDFEKELIKFAINQNIPLLGICHGMQIIADFFGCDFQKISGQIGIKEQIYPCENSRYFAKLSQIKKVNSYANFFINHLSDELKISATNDKNIIKAVEHKSLKIFAHMWHSEREEVLNNQQLELIKEILR